MFLCLLALSLGMSWVQSGPVVNTTLGQVLGWERVSRDGRPYQAWTGIPFAQPPTGKLRFQAPKSAEKWEGVLNATGNIPSCLQLGFGPSGGYSGSEDCLYLNVYRPKAPRVKRMPVLFYLYGGAFQGGSTGSREKADYLMDEEVVLVSANYRVNVFGFGTLADKTFPGNFGLKDAVMALRWIKQNIVAFGGDPKSVTVFGLSAGAQLAHHLLKSPLCDREDLVTQAVSDSGSINHVSSLMNAEEVARTTRKVAEIVECGKATNSEILACLQEAEVSLIMKAVAEVKPIDMSKQPFAPVIEPVDAEDAVIPEDGSLRPTKKPWITRYSNGEYTLFKMMSRMVPSEWFQNVSNNLTGYLTDWVGQHMPDKKEIGAAHLEQFYFPLKTPMENFIEEFAKLHADDGFTFPALFNIVMHQGPKWISRFEYPGSHPSVSPFDGSVMDSDVAGHAAEGFYYFNDPSKSEQTPADRAVSKRLIKYLVNFAYYSDPTPSGSSFKWPQFTSEKFEVLRTTANGDFLADETIVNQMKTILSLWSYVIGWK